MARQFYEGVLGFTAQGDSIEGVMYAAGPTTFLVYPSSYAGTNEATAISFQVDEASFDAVVATLRERGVAFQTFDMEGLTWADGHSTGIYSFRMMRAICPCEECGGEKR